MERQKVMTELNYNKEISYFSSLMNDLRYAWQDKEVSEILSRLACQVLGLGDKGRILAKEAGMVYTSIQRKYNELGRRNIIWEKERIMSNKNEIFYLFSDPSPSSKINFLGTF